MGYRLLEVLFLVAAEIVAFIGCFGLMYAFVFGRLCGFTDRTWREWFRFWFCLEYLEG